MAGQHGLAPRQQGTVDSEAELHDVGACAMGRERLVRHVEAGDVGEDGAEDAVAEVRAAIEHLEESDVAERRPHLGGVQARIMRQPVPAYEAAPVAQEKARRLADRGIARRVPDDLRAERAPAREGPGHLVVAAGGDIGRPSRDDGFVDPSLRQRAHYIFFGLLDRTVVLTPSRGLTARSGAAAARGDPPNGFRAATPIPAGRATERPMTDAMAPRVGLIRLSCPRASRFPPRERRRRELQFAPQFASRSGKLPALALAASPLWAPFGQQRAAAPQGRSPQKASS
jgi:hypothetical protein